MGIAASYGSHKRSLAIPRTSLPSCSRRETLLPAPADGRGPEIVLHLFRRSFRQCGPGAAGGRKGRDPPVLQPTEIGRGSGGLRTDGGNGGWRGNAVSVRPDRIPVLQQPFCFLRHGETSSNFEDTIAGSLDVPLTARGIEQSRVAAILLRDRGITSIHSSALRRARDTANCVADSLGLSVNVIAELGERSWGELEGKPRRLRIAGDTPAGGETPEAFRARILQGLAKIRADGLPLIVAHSGVFRVLCGLLRLMPLESRIENARPVLITPVGKDRWQIEAM